MRRIAQIGLLFLLALPTLSSCEDSGSTPTSKEGDPIKVTSTFVVEKFGRSYVVDVLNVTFPDGVVEDVLQIHGDGVYISFGGSSGPYVPTVSDTMVRFSGHSFEILPTSNNFAVGAMNYNLRPGGKYVFYDGKYVGRE